jgi:Reverse transcriptase (RNA-dependent DNA polymerase)
MPLQTANPAAETSCRIGTPTRQLGRSLGGPKQTMLTNPIKEHRRTTKDLAKSLVREELFRWLVHDGYFPESYVLPPCFVVKKAPPARKRYFKVTKNGNAFKPDRTECVQVHFPKTELTDRTFGIIHPRIHNDIAYDLTQNWKRVVEALIPKDSVVTSYSFPVPIAKRTPGRVGNLRIGRMIYEFIDMTDDDLVSVAYRYTHLLKADIKNFYPSLYTHSIAWALHGKALVRQPQNIHNYNLLGNRLDKLFQNANDGCTNGVPIGPVVSDIVAEMIAGAVDRALTARIRERRIDCAAVRFKDDYRILVKSENDARILIKALQASLKEFNLELSDEKTKVLDLPASLFREWVSKYHAIHPRKRRSFSWKQFRELYLGVVGIDRACPGTGVVDRFLADILDRNGTLKLHLEERHLQRAISMLLMLGSLRIKAFPKIIAILESIMRSPFGTRHSGAILRHLKQYLRQISKDEERNKYLISWLLYFLVSNDFYKGLKSPPSFNDPITRSVATNRAVVFAKASDFVLFENCKRVAGRLSMLEHLDVFNPPKAT